MVRLAGFCGINERQQVGMPHTQICCLSSMGCSFTASFVPVRCQTMVAWLKQSRPRRHAW